MKKNKKNQSFRRNFFKTILAGGIGAVAGKELLSSLSTKDENESDESPSKQLKFIYKGYPQTLIMPIVGNSDGLLSFDDAHIDFGAFWTLVSNSGEMIKFFYRNTTTSMYYPQVIIGTSQATLSRYLVQARKIQL